jgi:hypothetical protein
LKAIPILTLLLILHFLFVTGVGANNIQVQNVHVNKIGDTVPVSLVLDTSPAGVAGYDITVSLSNSAVATITNVSFPAWAILNESTTFPASSVSMRAVDLYKSVDPGATNIPFGMITLRGDSVGSTGVIVTIKNITTDGGDSFTPGVVSGKFIIDSGGVQPIISNHTSTHLSQIPKTALDQARSNLHIAYGHTSHGSQVTDGMTGLESFANAPYGSTTYLWNDGIIAGQLDLDDYFVEGDLGNPDDRITWAARTREYLNNPANSDVNVVMWSWCGQADTSEENIDLYLNIMNQLEIDYPEVTFVYMTGHLVGSGEAGNLNQRNEQIRNYVRANNKVLFDFADIESYDPDWVYYGDKLPTDGCNYDYNNNGVTSQSGDPALPTNGDRNWAIDWQNSHTQGTDWYTCGAAHTQPLNANQKAYAAWWLWARLGGWDGNPVISSGVTDKVGVFHPSTSLWNLDYNGNFSWDAGDKAFSMGTTGDIPVAGDWNGDGKKEVGIFRNGLWGLDYNGNDVWDAGDKAFNLGTAGDIPVVGNWNGTGGDKVGIFRNGLWGVDYNGNFGWDGADKAFNLGTAGDIPVVGNWNGTGGDKVGIFRNGLWGVDYNGNFGWDGADKAFNFGQTGDVPVVGSWS